MKLIAGNQLVGTAPRIAVFRNLYEKPDGSRVSVRTSREFDMQAQRTFPDGKLTQYPPQAQIFAKYKL